MFLLKQDEGFLPHTTIKTEVNFRLANMKNLVFGPAATVVTASKNAATTDSVTTRPSKSLVRGLRFGGLLIAKAATSRKLITNLLRPSISLSWETRWGTGAGVAGLVGFKGLAEGS